MTRLTPLAGVHSGGQVDSGARSGTFSTFKHPAECGDEKQAQWTGGRVLVPTESGID